MSASTDSIRRSHLPLVALACAALLATCTAQVPRGAGDGASPGDVLQDGHDDDASATTDAVEEESDVRYEYPFEVCREQIPFEPTPPFEGVSAFCTPLGQPIHGCSGWVRGHHPWEISQLVEGDDFPRISGSLVATPGRWESLIRHADGAEVGEDRTPSLLRCNVARGCPTLQRVAQVAVPFDFERQQSRVSFAHQTASGDFIIGIDHGIRRISATGDALWTVWPLGRFHPWFTAFGVPGTDDTIVGWEYEFDGPQEVCRGIRGVVSRVSGEGHVVWSRAVSSAPIERVRLIPDTNQIAATVNGSGPDRYVIANTVFLDAETGAWAPVNQGIEQSLGTVGLGSSPDDLVTSETSVVLPGAGGAAGRLRVDPVDLTSRPASHHPVTVVDEFGEEQYFYDIPRNHSAIRWFDGSWLIRDGLGFYLLDFDTFEDRAALHFRDRFAPEWLGGVPLVGGGLVSHDGTIWLSWDYVHGIGITNPFSDDPDDTRVIVPQSSYDYLNGVVAQDGVIIHAKRQRSRFPIVVRAEDPFLDETLWVLSIPVESADPDGNPPPFLLLDDGTLVIFSHDGVISWWSTLHGGLANTPAPRARFDNYNSAIARSGPFPTEPEKEREWRFYWELEDEDAGNVPGDAGDGDAGDASDLGSDSDTSDSADAG